MSDETSTPEPVEPEPAPEPESEDEETPDLDFVVGDDGSVATKVGTLGGEPEESDEEDE